MDIRLDTDIRPVTEFRANAATLIGQVRDTKRAMVLTQHGRGAAVLVDVAQYQQMLEQIEQREASARNGSAAVIPAVAEGGASPEAATGPHSALVDAYKGGIDRTLIRENLSRSASQRLRRLGELAEFAAKLRSAPRRNRGES